MDSQTISRRRDELAARFGPWTAHNIELAPGVMTMPGRGDTFAAQFARILRTARDIIPGPVETWRVLDIGCLEGYYSVEFARLGAEVVGLEGREGNVAKSQLAKEALGLGRLSVVQADARELSEERFGRFDLIVCYGLLYHLDWPDVFTFSERMAAVCDRLALIATHIALRAEVTRTHGGRTYHGSTFKEHETDASEEERERSAWASLRDPESFWPTRASLYNILTDAGFTSVFRFHDPTQKLPDRDTLVALKGEGEPLAERWPEETPKVVTLRRRVARRLARLVLD